ncbi:acyl carrier protein [Streptomyces filamentosus]|uniref:Acyl carrier protein n=2 Tax=Streptomyces filamentosus TaxID=67294 RepID=Q50E75_STRFL|nr:MULTISPECIES: acyl carrier protein [Streptomyces]AAX31556.1 probable acyl carrier protein [Streptomyces filamentosus NRRL 11379]EFE72876.1 peptide synthetase 2 [Streptomyces filamentosus NRRL 15998]ESU51892.1 phosphopantetheine attachment site domain-containing protein [Streptomyces sp. HCCB10043]EWS90117.1 hypothetical protein SSIG_07483 [Streptomyces filamentosus NRRL 11379]MYR77130.1 acyl carrier protein [Streptomyces sp. SID5466]
MNPPEAVSTPSEVTAWITGQIAEFVNETPDRIAGDAPLTDHGLDSVSGVALCAQVEDRYGIEVDPELLWSVPTLNEFVQALMPQLADRT